MKHIVNTFDDGKILEVFYQDDTGQRQGIYQRYENGQMCKQCHFINDKLSGVHYCWTSLGTLKWVVFHENNSQIRLLDVDYTDWENGLPDYPLEKVQITVSKKANIEATVVLNNIIQDLEAEGRKYNIMYKD